jgi:uncharacterized membrane protein YfcA
VIDIGVPVDIRLALAVLTIVLAGVAKVVTGMGIPVAGLPILVALYGDLRLVLISTILATALADVPMLYKFRKSWREASILVGFILCGLVGIVLGSTVILPYVKTPILCAVLAVVVVAFILVSWFGKMPTMSRTIAARVGPLIGLICGLLQGSAGASGPVVTSYLVSSQLTRAGFLFSINAIFFALDWTQFTTLHIKYATTPDMWITSVAIAILAFAGMGIGFAIQKHINDVVFKRAVLVMLAFAAAGLIVRAASG